VYKKDGGRGMSIGIQLLISVGIIVSIIIAIVGYKNKWFIIKDL